MTLFAITKCGQARAVTEDMELLEGEYLSDALPLVEDNSSEIVWRNSELNRSDVQINKIQDGVTGLGSVAEWRKYRVKLRNWPDSADFPCVECRPVAPDA